MKRRAELGDELLLGLFQNFLLRAGNARQHAMMLRQDAFDCAGERLTGMRLHQLPVMLQHAFAVMGAGRAGLHCRQLGKQRLGLGLGDGRAQGLMRVDRRVNAAAVCLGTQKIVWLVLFKGIEIRYGHLLNAAETAVSIYDVIARAEHKSTSLYR